MIQFEKEAGAEVVRSRETCGGKFKHTTRPYSSMILFLIIEKGGLIRVYKCSPTHNWISSADSPKSYLCLELAMNAYTKTWRRLKWINMTTVFISIQVLLVTQYWAVSELSNYRRARLCSFGNNIYDIESTFLAQTFILQEHFLGSNNYFQRALSWLKQ